MRRLAPLKNQRPHLLGIGRGRTASCVDNILVGSPLFARNYCNRHVGGSQDERPRAWGPGVGVRGFLHGASMSTPISAPLSVSSSGWQLCLPRPWPRASPTLARSGCHGIFTGRRADE